MSIIDLLDAVGFLLWYPELVALAAIVLLALLVYGFEMLLTAVMWVFDLLDLLSRLAPKPTYRNEVGFELLLERPNAKAIPVSASRASSLPVSGEPSARAQ